MIHTKILYLVHSDHAARTISQHLPRDIVMVRQIMKCHGLRAEVVVLEPRENSPNASALGDWQKMIETALMCLANQATPLIIGDVL